MDQQPIVQQNFESNPGIMYKLGNIEAQLKAINDKLDKKESEQDKRIDIAENEISKLKEWRMYTIGGATVASAIVTFLIKVFPVG
jgi:hypothetical protein